MRREKNDVNKERNSARNLSELELFEKQRKYKNFVAETYKKHEQNKFEEYDKFVTNDHTIARVK